MFGHLLRNDEMFGYSDSAPLWQARIGCQTLNQKSKTLVKNFEPAQIASIHCFASCNFHRLPFHFAFKLSVSLLSRNY